MEDAIDHILSKIKKASKNKRIDEDAIKQVILAAAKESGRNYDKEEISKLINGFKTFYEQIALNPDELAPLFLQRGISEKQLKKIKKKVRSIF